MKITIFIIFCLVFSFAQAQDANKRKSHFYLENGIALQGYDAISYFSQKPQKGNSKFQTTHQGIIYQFANQANLDKFKLSPEKYEPTYGGWCAYAMGEKGEKVEVDPETYKIIDGKLYLFYNAFFNNTLKTWNGDEKRLKPLADRNWTKMIQ